MIFDNSKVEELKDGLRRYMDYVDVAVQEPEKTAAKRELADMAAELGFDDLYGTDKECN